MLSFSWAICIPKKQQQRVSQLTISLSSRTKLDAKQCLQDPSSKKKQLILICYFTISKVSEFPLGGEIGRKWGQAACPVSQNSSLNLSPIFSQRGKDLFGDNRRFQMSLRSPDSPITSREKALGILSVSDSERSERPVQLWMRFYQESMNLSTTLHHCQSSGYIFLRTLVVGS